MRFFATEQLGPKQFMSPEGFLICLDVPIARTGSQIYGPDECPVQVGPDGISVIHRNADQVFHTDTMASANGKDICDDHPADDVMPSNYRLLSCGVMINIRRGEGTEDELLLADFVVKTPEMIDDIVNKKKIEVSLGYAADYVQTAVGVGEQRKIRVNHVALVPRGRCGPRCSISDHAHQPVPEPIPQPLTTDSAPETECGCHKEKKMTTKTFKQRVLDALKGTGKFKDEEMDTTADSIVEAAGKAKDEEAGGGGVHVHLPAAEGNFITRDEFSGYCSKNDEMHKKTQDSLSELASKMTPAEKEEATAEKENEPVKDELSEEAPEGKKDEAVKARDSAYLEASFTDTLASAEILFPGITPPLTFDRAMKPAKTYKDGICALRAKTLDAFYGTEPGKAFIGAALNGRTLDTKSMSCQRVADLFHGAVAHKKALNNGMVGDLTLSKGSMKSDAPFGSTMAVSADALAEQAAAAWK